MFKLHSYEATPDVASVAVKLIDSDVEARVPEGALVKAVVGETLSTVHVNAPGVESVPVALVARTLKVWVPLVNPVKLLGDVHAA